VFFKSYKCLKFIFFSAEEGVKMPISFNSAKILRPLDFFFSLVNDVDRTKEEIIIYSSFVGGWEEERLYEQLKKVIKKSFGKSCKN